MGHHGMMADCRWIIDTLRRGAMSQYKKVTKNANNVQLLKCIVILLYLAIIINRKSCFAYISVYIRFATYLFIMTTFNRIKYERIFIANNLASILN